MNFFKQSSIPSSFVSQPKCLGHQKNKNKNKKSFILQHYAPLPAYSIAPIHMLFKLLLQYCSQRFARCRLGNLQ